MSDALDRRVFPDARAAAAACAAHVIDKLEDAISNRGYATLALSGGSSPRLMLETLAAARFPWDRVRFFWVDERAVPPTDPQSNYRLAAETLLGPVGVAQKSIHRIQAELMPEAAARAYAEDIRSFFGLESGEMPQFDLVHRGMGAEGHTASLFPGEPLIEDRQGIAAAVRVPVSPRDRITLLPGPLLHARHTAMLVTGADKAEALRAALEGPLEPLRFPVQLATRNTGLARWFLDQAAARLLDNRAD